MNAFTRRFYKRVKSVIERDSDLPNFFTYYLTIELGQPAAAVSAVKRCYEECDLHAPSWLASHFSNGLRSSPKRFIRKNGGYRLEDKLREFVAARIESSNGESIAVGNSDLAGIQYLGVAGASKDCEDAVVMLIQFGSQIKRARILTSDRAHCLLLTDEVGDDIAIKSGFSSGYGGTGPRAFSYILQLLYSHGVDIEEYQVDKALIGRIDRSALTLTDLKWLNAADAFRPSRWRDYVDVDDFDRARVGALWQKFPLVVPYAIIDPRIIDLARSFWYDPDDKLLKGYRRLEDLIRARTGIDEHGTKLLSQTFSGNKPKLGWSNIDDSERIGRANLFTGAYMAHRNPRAHRELKTRKDDQLAEFLLLNHLYRLEQEAISTLSDESDGLARPGPSLGKQ